jgi:hypothetical protein
MARLNFEDFLDKEVIRVYIAGRLSEAKRVESTLDENNVDYAIDIEPFVMRVLGLFPSLYMGAGLYVHPWQAAFARSTLQAAGLTTGIEEDEAA